MKEDLEPVDPALIEKGDLVILNIYRDHDWFKEKGLKSGDEFIVISIKKRVLNRRDYFDIFARPVSRAQDILSTLSFFPDELRLPKFRRVQSPF